MKISKIINNNVVSTWDDEGREIIVMGRGVGFK
ncbi:MAG: CAT RNA binding domain-containing protein, partial [Clostridiales bacterium]|nr:CAT RNA binding domain-containing protein [Clostridiales bacterium]